MKAQNKVFIATSLDGFIADAQGGIDWLHAIPNPENDDMGYVQFTSEIDALVMGRTTFETVAGFDIDWPYTKPVFVLSNSLKTIPTGFEDKIELVNGALKDVLIEIHQKGFHQLYIDGGRTIQSFLKEDLIDEMVITIIPTLLGKGIPLFDELPNQLTFECIETKHFIGKVAQNRFVRKK